MLCNRINDSDTEMMLSASSWPISKTEQFRGFVRDRGKTKKV